MLPESLHPWILALLRLLQQNDEKALFFLLMIEEAGVPIPAVPGDVIIMLAGYRASLGEMSLPEVVLATTFGVQLGSTILYMLSRRFGHALISRYGRFIHLDRGRLARVERWIQQRGPIVVFLGRLTPGLRISTSVAAGIFQIPFRQFMLYATMSALIWCLFWVAMGYFFGSALLPLVTSMHYSLSAGIAAAMLVVAAAAAICLWYRRNRRISALRCSVAVSTAASDQT